MVGLDHGDDRIPHLLAAPVHPQRSQLVQSGVVVRRSEGVQRKQRPGDTLEQLPLDGSHTTEIMGLTFQQRRQLQILFQEFEIFGKMAGQQGRNAFDVRRIGRPQIIEQPDPDLTAVNLQPGKKAPRCTTIVVGGEHFRKVSEIPLGDSLLLPLPFQGFQPRRHGRISRIPDQQGFVPAAGHHLALGIGDGQAHLQMVRQVIHRPGRRRNIHIQALKEKPAQGGGQAFPAPGHLADNGLHRVGHRNQLDPVGFGQPLDQGGNLLGQHPGHQPVQLLPGYVTGRFRWDGHSDAVGLRSRLERIITVQDPVAQVQLPGKLVQHFRIRCVADQHLPVQPQETIVSLFSYPVFQGPDIEYTGEPILVERHQHLVVHQNIPSPDPVLHAAHGFHQGGIVVHEPKRLSHVPFHQGAADKDVRSLRRVDAAEGHTPIMDDGQAEQGHLLFGHHLSAAALPVGIGPAGSAQVAPKRLQPGHIHHRRLAGKQAGRLHHLRRHDPVTRILEQARTGEKHHFALLGRPEEHLLFFQRDVGEKPAED